MIDLSIAANAEERIALRLFRAMEQGTLLNEMAEICSDDLVWGNSGLPTLKGQEEIRDLMTPHIAGVVDVVDGKIVALRDFYDVACCRQTPTEINPEFTLAAHRLRFSGK